MRKLLNTLYVLTQGTTLRKESNTVVVESDTDAHARIPLVNIESIFCFGQVRCTPKLLGMCAQRGVAVHFLTQHGRLLASVHSNNHINVHLRRRQYRIADDSLGRASIARSFVVSKIASMRTCLRRAARDPAKSATSERLDKTARRLNHTLKHLPTAASIEQLRGYEGEATRAYFSVFDAMILRNRDGFPFPKRTRRPPMDPVNAMLSLGYSLLYADAASACAAHGLDSQVGFLHCDRSGRSSLALDLMEEFRPFLVDRLVLSLINRQQVSPSGFEATPANGIRMNAATLRTLITAYQQRKQTSIFHHALNQPVSLGLAVWVQARQLARHIRGEIENYQPFSWK